MSNRQTIYEGCKSNVARDRPLQKLMFKLQVELRKVFFQRQYIITIIRKKYGNHQKCRALIAVSFDIKSICLVKTYSNMTVFWNIKKADKKV